MTGPGIGTMVTYTLTTEDTLSINARRFLQSSGRQGNVPAHGDTCPALVVAVPNPNTPTAVNLQVFLDGNDTHWATDIHPGTGPGFWMR